ncbi:DUF3050 domain-containing protein [uncultured Aquimarina sp.]|uniref:DUF3050 domain-containing protein n=1 Tax=uncultured Aquimarina sp. TaxID=575652 RepID=UPI0026110D73|nr:DUF3050 domain-containing protein [uncultured Aquimarina sp.]
MMNIEDIINELKPIRQSVLKSTLYDEIHTIDDIRIFTEYHVFAVWDFMSLLKSLQLQLTTVAIPWIPSKNLTVRRFVNEIVFGEESDIDKDGNPMSHYEMYLEAMQQIQADITPITKFVNLIKSGETVENAMNTLQVAKSIKDFVNFTFEVIETQKPHIIAGVFTFGREDLIPDLFMNIVKKVGNNSNLSLDKFVYYLERHIELDGDDHGPLSLKMVSQLCGDDIIKWKEVMVYSKIALQKRMFLWESVSNELTKRKLDKKIN